MMNTQDSRQVLVTGAAGWLGLNLLQALVHGVRQHELLREPPAGGRIRCLLLPGQDPAPVLKISSRIEIVHGDVRVAEDCRRLCAGAEGAVLFHAAGLIHPRRVRELYDVNVEGTKNLLSAAVAARVKRVVAVSSNSPCGCNPHRDHLFDEDSPYRPYMHYGRSKVLMEQALQAASRGAELETVIIRAPWFYGPFQPARQTLFFEMIRDGRAPVVGGGENLRSMAYTENLAQGLLLAGTVREAAGRIYWIADERPYSMNEVIDTVERLLETEFGTPCAHRRLRLPGMASEIAWLVDKSLQSVGLYHQKIHVLSEMNKTIACSVERARNELGYRPQVQLEEGMRRSLAWCRANGQWLGEAR